jgi:hypothetical protein
VNNEFMFDALDILLAVEHEDDLTSILDDFGVRMADFDPSILNAE